MKNSLSHTVWECKIPHCLGTQETSQGYIRQVAPGTEDDFEPVVPVQGGASGGGDVVCRPCAYVSGDTAQIQRIHDGGVFEGQECHHRI